MNSLISHTTDTDFSNDVLNSDLPVLLDFWAEWCGPCKAIAPALDDLAKEYEGQVRVIKINIDSNPKTPQKLGIRGIPTLMMFKGGQVQATHIGAAAKGQLAKLITANL